MPYTMNHQPTRRTVLQKIAAGGLAGLGGGASLHARTSTTAGLSRPHGHERSDPSSTVDGGAGATIPPADPSVTVWTGEGPIGVRGAIYLPARAFNFYQLWRGYDRAVIERDLDYAARLNLNAIRTIASFEWWREAPAAHGAAIDHLLQAADARGIKVLLGLFEGIGAQPTRENLLNTDPLTATAVSSPAGKILLYPREWDRPRAFVRWLMDRYRDDDRLLALEVMNEPGWARSRVAFSCAMFRTMRIEQGSVPLTIGAHSLAQTTDYLDWQPDLLQFHYNFPTSRAVLADALQQVRTLATTLAPPVWFTEWQRIRSGPGFHTPPPVGQRVPNYSSMVPVITEAGFGNFFWSLMLKPAYVRSQRKLGILNGLFHEDGAVYSRDDACAITAMSGETQYDGPERRAWPDWAQGVKETYLDT
jgi:hypothetical protein